MNQPTGLTDQEVAERQRDGRVNRTKAPVAKPLSRILADNLFTVFNAVNAAIAAALIFVGSYHNLLFIGVVIGNSLIGILQELRSKRTLEKLSLLRTAKARVRRNGEDTDIPLKDIVQDDRLVLKSGDQICVDAVVQCGRLEVDESLLTGESATVLKSAGDELLSGSFVAAGHGEALAVRVGADAYANKLTAQATVYKRLRTPLMLSVDSIIRFTGLFMIPFAVLLLLHEWYSGEFVLKDAVTSTAAALIGMMPQGLILLTSVALAVGVIRLAGKHTLVQELCGIESLSRASMLCLDKTGTITKGTMTVSDVIPLSDAVDDTLIGTAIRAIGDSNPTADALARYYTAADTLAVHECRPFSPVTKYSAVSFHGIGSVFFGAYDRLFEHTPLPDAVSELARSGKRILAVAFSGDPSLASAMSSLTPLAAVVLEDELRDNAREIVGYFQREDVLLRVISGDHPDTVSAVAAKAGIPHADRAIDASVLTTPDALREAAAHYVVFGRVSPEQKRELIRCFKEQGHTVAMTGDGVNDVAALKEADCSVAMACGSDAAKQVSQLVLLDSDFAALPDAVAQGRRVVNNITRTASLFLVKTVMSFLVTLCTVLLPMHYPFEPLQLTLIGIFAESVPGFFLTLEPTYERIKGRFLHTVLCNAVPSAVIIALFVTFTQLFVSPLLSLSAEQSATLCVYLTGFVWLVQLHRICRPLTPARRLLWWLMTIGFFGSALLLASFLPAVFAALGFASETVLVMPTTPMLLTFAAFAAVSFPLEALLHRLARRILK